MQNKLKRELLDNVIEVLAKTAFDEFADEALRVKTLGELITACLQQLENQKEEEAIGVENPEDRLRLIYGITKSEDLYG